MKLGERVFSYAKHSSVVDAGTRFVLPLPAGLDPKLAVVARMGQVAFTSVRVSSVQLGDVVAVLGMGLVGNIAAQLMALSGATVIGVDVSEKRLAVAKACGIHYTVNAKSDDPVQAVKAITHGAMCHAVVEATGIPDQVLTATRLAGKAGEGEECRPRS